MQGTHRSLTAGALLDARSSGDIIAMTMTTVPELNPGRVRLATNGKPPALKVTGKVAQAIRLMIQEGMPWDQAATAVGMPVRTMRLAIAKPHVIKWMKAEREVFRDHICAANIHRLAEIRDHKPNMPAVNAILALERRDDEKAIAARQTVPGFVIVCKGDVQVTDTRGLSVDQHGDDRGSADE